MSFSQPSRFLTPDMIESYFDIWSLGVGASDPTQDSGPSYSL